MTSQNKEYNKVRGIQCEIRLEAVMNELAIAYQSKEELADFICTIEASIEKDEHCIRFNEEAHNNLRQQIDQLEEEKRRLEARKKEADNLWWVPFYGLGVLIRNEVEGDRNRYNHAIEEQSRLAQEQASLNHTIEQSRARLNTLRNTFNGRQDNIAELEVIKANLEQEKKIIAQEVILSSLVEMYYELLEQKASNTLKRIENVENITMYAEGTEDSALVAAKEFETLNLKEALAKVGQTADVGSLDEAMTFKEALLKVSLSGDKLPLLIEVAASQLPVLPAGLAASPWQETVKSSEQAHYLVVRRSGFTYCPLNYVDKSNSIVIVAYDAAEQLRPVIEYAASGGYTGTMSLDLQNDTLVLMCKAEEGISTPLAVPWNILNIQ